MLKIFKMISPTVSAVLIIIPIVVAYPASLLSDTNLNKFHNNFEVVEGPREFVVPIPPLKDVMHLHRTPDNSGTPKLTDLDYMVYGKLYLMKALKSAERSASGFDRENTDYVMVDPSYHLNQQPYLKESAGDTISFPTNSKKVNRSYQFKNRRKVEEINSAPFNHQHADHTVYRKLEERSADQEYDSSSSTSRQVKEVSTVNSQQADTTTPRVSGEDLTIDKEALDLIQKLTPASSTTEQTSSSGEAYDGEIRGNNQNGDFNLTTDNFQFDDRFLISVPMKPNFTRCPEGQRRTHRGACKPVFVHRQSPNDGFLMAVTTNTQRNEKIQPAAVVERKTDFTSLQLTTLLRSVVQLEKRLEKVIKDAEKQFVEMGQERSNSSSSTTSKSEPS